MQSLGIDPATGRELFRKKDGTTTFTYTTDDYIIAGGQKRYEARQNIDIPTDIDPGDYHFVIRVTDKTGWQQILAVEIEIE